MSYESSILPSAPSFPITFLLYIVGIQHSEANMVRSHLQINMKMLTSYLQDRYEAKLVKEIYEMEKDCSGFEACQVWLKLLGYYFPYCFQDSLISDQTQYVLHMITEPQTPLTTLSVEGLQGDHRGICFFHVHIRETPGQGIPYGWEKAEMALITDLNGLLARDATKDVYGAIVFGPYVRFYRHTGEGCQMTLGWRGKEVVNLVSDGVIIAGHLETIKRDYA